MKSICLVFVLLFSAMAQAQNISPRYEKIFVVIFENANATDVLQQSYFVELVEKGVYFENFHGETHPSQGNYVALVSGSTYGIKHDFKILLDVPHVGDLMEGKALDWKVYAEGYPGNCFLGDKGDYKRKHVPFLSFKNIQSDKARCRKRIVNAEQLDLDFANEDIPHLSFYVPNMRNDGHNTDLAFADNWFRKRFEPFLANQEFMDSLLFVTTFDESKSFFKNHIYTSFYASDLKQGYFVPQYHDHYSLLRLIEDNFDLGHLGQADEKASPIEGIWRASDF